MKLRLVAIEITGEGNHLDTRMSWLIVDDAGQAVGHMSSGRHPEALPTLAPRPKSAQADPWETKTTYKSKR